MVTSKNSSKAVPVSLEELRSQADEAYNLWSNLNSAIRAAEVFEKMGITLMRNDSPKRTKGPTVSDISTAISPHDEKAEEMRKQRFSLIKSFMDSHDGAANIRQLAVVLKISTEGVKQWMQKYMTHPDAPYKQGENKSNYLLK